MIDKEDFNRLVAAILEAERFQKQDLRNMIPGYKRGEIDRAIWAAQEDVRKKHGIAFGVTPGFPELYRRLDHGQLAHQARRQRGAGVRKIYRSADKLALAAEKTGDEKEKERLEREASRTKERAAYRAKKNGPT